MTPDDERYRYHAELNEELLASGATREDAYWQTMAARREERLRLSDRMEFRSDTPEPDSAYEGYTHGQLKDMVTEGLSVSQVGSMAEAWSNLANTMAGLSDRLYEQLARTDSEWQGEAAESAKAYTGALANWTEETGRRAQLMSHHVSLQSDAANMAHHRMPEPVPFDLEQELAAWSNDPATMNDHVMRTLQRQQEHEEAKRQAVEVMTEYDDNLQAAARQPTFPGPPKLEGVTPQEAEHQLTAGPAAAGADGTGPAATTSPSAGAAPPNTAAGDAETVGRRVGGIGNTSGEAGSGSAAPRDLAGGRVVGTNPAMPFHNGGAGVPAATSGATGRGGPSMSPGLAGGLGAGRGRADEEADAEHTNSYVVEDWTDDDWYADLPRPIAPVIGATTADADADDAGTARSPS